MTERKATGFQVTERPQRPEVSNASGLNVVGPISQLPMDGIRIPGGIKGGDGAQGDGRILVVPERPKLAEITYPEISGVEFKRVNPYVVAVDMRPILNKYHPNWRGEIEEVARQQAEIEIIPGSVATSMAEPGSESTFYQPTRQNVIKEQLSWVHKLFKNEFRYLAERLTGDRTMTLGIDATALNVNRTQSGPYEPHVDRNGLTGLLGVTNVKEGEGGELVIYQTKDEFNRPAGRRFSIRPQAGILYFFNGLKHPHEVTPYTGLHPRLVMPGDYFSAAHPEILDAEFNKNIIGDGKLNLVGAELLGHERVSESGNLVLVDFSRRKKVQEQHQPREVIQVVRSRSAA